MHRLLNLFSNKPILSENRSWFVNREPLMQILQDIARYDVGNIYGIATERGGGKTSILNLLEEKSFKKLILNITERTTRELIYCDMIMGLCDKMKQFKDFRKHRKELDEIEQFLSYHVTRVSQGKLGATAIIEAAITEGTTSEDRFNIYTLKKRLSRVLNILSVSKQKYVIFMD